MAGNVYDFRAVADAAQVLDMFEFDAVVQPIPQAAERHGHESDECLRIVGGDFQRVLARQQQRGATLQVTREHLLAHRLAHRLGLQYLQHHGAPMRQIRTDGGRALRAQHHAQ